MPYPIAPDGLKRSLKTVSDGLEPGGHGLTLLTGGLGDGMGCDARFMAWNACAPSPVMSQGFFPTASTGVKGLTGARAAAPYFGNHAVY